MTYAVSWNSSRLQSRWTAQAVSTPLEFLYESFAAAHHVLYI